MATKYMQAKFLISAEKLSQCPDYTLPEFPLLGRSNVGKSSFINGLANHKKVSKEAQNRWQKYLEEYLLKREQITSLVQLIDGRHDIQKNDFQMREWVEAYNLPIFTIVTKMDYVPKSKTLNVIKK